MALVHFSQSLPLSLILLKVAVEKEDYKNTVSSDFVSERLNSTS